MAESAQTISKSSSSEKAQIKLDIDRVLGNVDDKVYSGFTEHMGRCIYGGLVDYDNKVPGLTNEKGYRLDVANALKDLNMPVVRYPGGNFVATYHWLDGVGPRDKRPRRPELAWLNEESNQFGTDEFMDWCKFMNVEPYLCLNMGTGSLDEALAWVEYCNSTANTYYANLRRKNGHPEPYKVKYWSLGNEVYGEWQVEQNTAPDYGKKAYQWAKALKLLDPSITLIACGCNGFDTWDYEITQKLISKVDMYSIHLYTYHTDYYKNVTAPAGAERAIQITAKLLDLARITQGSYGNKVKICFDEWNVWDPVGAEGRFGAEQHYELCDALAVASWLNIFVRQAAHIGMANIAQCVNVIAPIMTTKTGMFLQTIYHPFLLFSKYMRGKSLNLHVKTPLYTGETDGFQGLLKWVGDSEPQIALLDCSATVNNKFVTIAVVNRSLTEDLKTTFELQQKFKSAVQVWTLTHADIRAKNSIDKPDNVILKQSTVEVDAVVSNGYIFPKHSFTMLRLELA